jgi:hypothetical protein
LSTAGACTALIGLPDYIGTRAALMGIGVYSMALSGLFLSVDLPRVPKTSVGPAILLMMGATALIDVLTIRAFYTVSLPLSGVALAIVVLSTALLTVSMIGFLQPSGLRQAWRDVSSTMTLERGWIPSSVRLQGGVAVGLAFLSLVIVLVFDPLIAPLMPMLIKEQSALDIPAVALSLLAWGGGVILYLTRDSWALGMGGSQPHESPTALEAQKS